MVDVINDGRILPYMAREGNWLDRRDSPMGGVICVGTEVVPHRPENFWSSRYLILFARCGFRVSLLMVVAEG